MSNASDNFVLNEEDMSVIKLTIEKNGRTVEKMVDDYKRLLAQVRVSALLEGKTAEQLNELIANVKVLDNHVKTLSQRYSKLCGDLVEEVDRRDRYLY